MLTDRQTWMENEVKENVPADVREALAAAGFTPTLDAGNLWFFDRDSQRLLFGEDGSDYPSSLDEPVTVCNGHDDDGTEYPTLNAALQAISQ